MARTGREEITAWDIERKVLSGRFRERVQDHLPSADSTLVALAVRTAMRVVPLLAARAPRRVADAAEEVIEASRWYVESPREGGDAGALHKALEALRRRQEHDSVGRPTYEVLNAVYRLIEFTYSADINFVSNRIRRNVNICIFVDIVSFAVACLDLHPHGQPLGARRVAAGDVIGAVERDMEVLISQALSASLPFNLGEDGPLGPLWPTQFIRGGSLTMPLGPENVDEVKHDDTANAYTAIEPSPPVGELNELQHPTFAPTGQLEDLQQQAADLNERMSEALEPFVEEFQGLLSQATFCVSADLKVNQRTVGVLNYVASRLEVGFVCPKEANPKDDAPPEEIPSVLRCFTAPTEPQGVVCFEHPKRDAEGGWDPKKKHKHGGFASWARLLLTKWHKTLVGAGDADI